MVRVIGGLLGVLLALFPERCLETYESVAIENRDECSRRSWIVPAVRVEGVGFLLASLLGGQAYARLLDIVGLAGSVALVAPQRYLRFGGRVGYTGTGPVEWNRRFVTAVRIIGALVLAAAVRNRASSDR